jgi:zinc protease
LQLLERVMRIQLTDTLREKLGKAYSPGASSSASRTWKGYGTFSVSSSVDVKEVPATRSAIGGVVAALRDAPVSEDVIKRAREPMLESYDNLLKTNAGWLGLVDRAQTEPEDIARFSKSKAVLQAITPADLQAAARKYLPTARWKSTSCPKAWPIRSPGRTARNSAAGPAGRGSEATFAASPPVQNFRLAETENDVPTS